MKKILSIIIITLLISIGIDIKAQSFNSGDVNQSGFNSGNINQSGFNSGDINQPGFNSGNVMLGGDGSAAATGLGNNNSAGSGFFGQTPNYNSNNVPKVSLEGLVWWLVGILNQLVYVIIGASLVMFLYGILRLSFVDGHKPEAREQARRFMFWGIVSLFVMVSVWGLVKILQVTFFGSGSLILPQFK